MLIDINCEVYSFYKDINGVTCGEKTANKLGLNVNSNKRCTLQNYDMFLELIANKHNMTIAEVKKFKIRNDLIM